MAKRMMTSRQVACWSRRSIVACSALLAFLSAASLTVTGAELRDPTRPPLPRRAEQGRGTAPHLPVLESVLLLPGYKAAIIDGQTVMLGDLYNGARLVALTEKTARLRKGAKVSVLHLAPATEAGEPASMPDGPAAAMEKTN